MLENYLECYHCAIAHPGFSAAIDVRPEHYDLAVHGWFSSQIGEVRDSALEGRSQVKIYDAKGEITQSQFHLLFPNMTININPGFPNLSIDIWWPNGPNGTKGFSEQYFAPGVSETFAQDLIAFNQQVGIEDDDLTDSVQRGLRAGMVDQGRFLTGAEHLVGHFQKLIVHMVHGDQAAIAAISPDGISQSVPLAPTPSAPSQAESRGYIPLEVVRVEPECAAISSIYLRPLDEQKLHPWHPGHLAPVPPKHPLHRPRRICRQPVRLSHPMMSASTPTHSRPSWRSPTTSHTSPSFASTRRHSRPKPTASLRA